MGLYVVATMAAEGVWRMRRRKHNATQWVAQALLRRGLHQFRFKNL